MTQDKWQDVYAKYLDYPRLSYLCIEKLLNENEIVWKLLKYPVPDALDQPNLTLDEKIALIYKADGDIVNFNVFMDIGQNEVFTRETTIIRIAPFGIHPDNHIYGSVLMSFETYAHYNINHLNNYQTRVDTIMGEFLKTFIGANIAGIGRLTFNMMEDQSNKMTISGMQPFKGKQLFMSNKVNS